jgi:hypothetical protein
VILNTDVTTTLLTTTMMVLTIKSLLTLTTNKRPGIRSPGVSLLRTITLLLTTVTITENQQTVEEATEKTMITIEKTTPATTATPNGLRKARLTQEDAEVILSMMSLGGSGILLPVMSLTMSLRCLTSTQRM